VTQTYIGVVGAGDAPPGLTATAEAVGAEIAKAGAVVVCGGLDGVMAAACRGATMAGGTTIGILPGANRVEANEWVSIAIPTGLGEARNVLVVRASDALIAIGGEYGTLSEVAFGLKLGLPVVGIATWGLHRHDGTRDSGVIEAGDPTSAVSLAMELARHQGRR
jgi:uncharacterized protein (TIGR00725 family)